MGLFKKEASLEEMEEEYERKNEQLRAVKTDREILEQKVAMKQLNDRLGKGGWKAFSSNGKLNGFSLKSAMSWLKSH